MSYKSNPIINYVRNQNIAGSASGYTAYADAAGALPVDGTGGSPTVTVAASTAAPLRGLSSLRFTKPASNTQGQGFSTDITIDNIDQGRMLLWSADVELVSGTYDEGTQVLPSDLTCYIYDVTNGVLLPQPAQYRIIPNAVGLGGVINVEFQSNVNSTQYRLIWHCATTSALAYTLDFDNITCGPSRITRGALITDWQSYTPTFANLGTPTSVDVQWRRVGKNIEISGRWVNGTVGGGAATFTIPPGLSVSYANARVVGNYGSQGSATGNELVWGGSNLIQFGMANWLVQATGTNLATGGFTTVEASLEIQGWSSSQQLSSDAGTRDVLFVGSINSTTALTANVTPIPLLAEKDTHAGWSTNQYTIPVAGDYDFDVQAQVTVNQTSSLTVYVNGTQTARVANAYNWVVYTGTTTIRDLKAGDIITFRSNSAVTTASDSSCKFVIARRASPQQLAASEKIFFQARKSSAQSIPNNTQTTVTNWTNVDVDSTGSFNATTGIYTVQRAGIARIGMNVGWANNATGVRQGIIVLNGTTVAAKELPGSTTANTNVDPEYLGPVKAGDLIRVDVFQGSGGALNTAASAPQMIFSVEIN